MSGVLSSSYKQVAAVKSGCIGVYRQYNTCNTEVSLGSIINTCTRAAALILCNLSSIIGCIHYVKAQLRSRQWGLVVTL